MQVVSKYKVLRGYRLNYHRISRGDVLLIEFQYESYLLGTGNVHKNGDILTLISTQKLSRLLHDDEKILREI